MLELTLRLVFSLAAVVGLMLLIAKFTSRRFRGAQGAAVTILHRQSLTRSSSVSLVTVGERVLLLGVTEHQVSLLTEVDPLELPETLPGLADGTADELVIEAEAAPELSAPIRPHLVPEPKALTEPVSTGDVVADLIAARAAAAEPQPEARPVRAVEALAADEAVAPSVERVTAAPAQGALAGSVLSVQTWRQAFAAATRRAS
ncbi:FliO/MopB family protein [Nocardioides ferulae]|uniref:FliO/MopB family protein n=1 Tax=Nocardioides ferulae TaxID=2340821 RepID=UPI000EB0AB0A|nr:flagellar biosynthetic protein FliO [Nocardioides ferulae]